MKSTRHVLIAFCLGFNYLILSAQNYEKVWFDRTDSIYGYYTVVRPAGPRIQGAVVLLDGYGGNASAFYTETMIHNVAYSNDLLTVSIPTGMRLFLDEHHLATIRQIMNSVAKEFGIRNDRFAIGGFSSGGTLSLTYTERSYERQFEIKPRVVFTADSPVDLLDLYESSKRSLKSKSQGWWLGEAKMIVDSLDKKLGPPALGMANYRKFSPFLRIDSMPGNEQYLQTVAYRTYHDVDVQWRLKYRQQSIYETNMLNASELVNRLQLSGNSQVEFVASKTPGRRSNGWMHPHSWSIVDEIDLVYWIREKLDFYPGDISKRYSNYDVAGWNRESVLFPLDFAPSIIYKGFEDIRFAPNCWTPASDEKWAYTFVWWLDDQYLINEKILQQNLEDYYSGLTHKRVIDDKGDLNSYFPSKASVTRVATASNDLATYSAVIHFYDALVTKKPADLYAKVHVKSCSDKTKTVVLFEIAGSPTSQPVWKRLDKINADFKCMP